MSQGNLPWYWSSVDLFDGISDNVRSAVLSQSERLVFRRGAQVFCASDAATQVFILAEGLIKIYSLSDEGEQTIFWYCVPGELFGAGGISGTGTQSVFGQAHEKSVVYALARGRFEQLIHQHPQLALNALRLMGARLRLACDAVTDRITRKVDARMARILVRLAQNWGEFKESEIHFRIRITQQELAHLLGATRQTVNQLLNEFAQQGLIRFDSRTLIVRNLAQLAQKMDTASPRRPLRPPENRTNS